MKVSNEELIKAAEAARNNASAPYSGFKVGASLLTAEGEIVVGCNVESASYGLTVCAERSAIFSAIANGRRSFERLAVVVDTDELTPPCGACRQVIWEFCGDIPVLLANPAGKTETLQMADLLPRAFDSSFFK
jgi:cytidine deaminase